MRLLLYRYFILILVTMLKVKEKREKSSPPRPSLRRCDSTRLHSTRRDATQLTPPGGSSPQLRRLPPELVLLSARLLELLHQRVGGTS
jgi:hypothetical protein